MQTLIDILETATPDHVATAELVAAAAPHVGEIAMSWGFIESNLRAVYWTLGRTRGVPMPENKASLEVVVDIVRQAGTRLPELQGDLGGMLGAAASEAKSIGRVRNIVCHWPITAGRQKPKPGLQFSQWRGDADGNAKFEDQWFNISELQLYATRSKALGSIIIELAGKAIEILEPSG